MNKLTQKAGWTGLLAPLLYWYLGLVSFFFLVRLSLLAFYFERVTGLEEPIALTFLYGLRMDTIVSSVLLLVPALLLTLVPARYKNQTKIVLLAYGLVVLVVVTYIEAASFPFMAQFDVRPNYLFIAYLEYPHEVMALLLAEYKMALLLYGVLIFFLGKWFLKSNKHLFDAAFLLPWAKKLLVLPVIILILAMGVRSSFGHRPANNSDALFSTSRLLNEITKNSVYNVSYAWYAQKYFGSKSLKRYGKMSVEEANQRVKKLLGIQSEGFYRLEKSHFPRQKNKNLVILVQESLGAQFVAAAGGEPKITPHLNQLATTGINFTQLYSNGTRSIRGLSGLVAGFLAVPGKGVVKRNRSQTDFFTVASLLKPRGYKSLFLYGGESRFDNMRSWFLGNGFDKIVDEPKFVAPEFVGTWGVSDEDLLRRANQEFKQLHQAGQPFVSVVFSTSNHTPFDFPDNKITLVDGVAKKSVKNAIKYADHAIGIFVELAKKEAYYKDTIFVVVADHNVRVYGNSIVPVEMFRIPAVIFGGGVEPQNVSRLSSQPDVLATAVDLLGMDLSYPILGNSIFKADKQDFSLMQFNTTYALRKGNKVAVLQENKPAKTFTLVGRELKADSHDTELEKDALAFLVTLQSLYLKQSY